MTAAVPNAVENSQKMSVAYVDSKQKNCSVSSVGLLNAWSVGCNGLRLKWQI